MSRRGGSYDGQRRVSLLVRNLPLDMRSEELRAKFEKYGDIRDVYLPRDYYTQRARGFGFVEFRDCRDAEDAMRALDRSIVGGREISVILSKEARKTPRDMLSRERTYRDSRGDRRARSRSPRRGRGRSYSRSPSRSRDRDRAGRRGRSYSRSRSRSPEKARSYSRSPSKSRSPEERPKDRDDSYQRADHKDRYDNGQNDEEY